MKIGGEVIPRWARLRPWLIDAGLTPDELEEASTGVGAAVGAWRDIAAAVGVPEPQIGEMAATHERIAGQMKG